VLPALLMAAVAVALGWQVYALRDALRWVDHTDVVIARASEVARLQLEHENGLRGYMLSDDRGFLRVYEDAERAIDPALDALERLVADSADQVARVRRLRELNDAWDRHAAETLEAHERGGDPAAGAALRERKALLDGFRGEAARILQTEEKLRIERTARAQRASRNATASIVALTVLVTVALAFVTRSQVRRVSALYARTARQASDRAEALAESEERFRLFVEGVHDSAIFILDTHGHVQSWNAGAERIFGYTPDEILGRHFSVFHAREDVAEGAAIRELEAAFAAGRTETEAWRVRKDGSRFWAAVTLRALRDRQGRLVGYVKLVRDTTERKRAEMRRGAQYGVARVLSEATAEEDALVRCAEAVASALGYDVGVVWSERGEALRFAAAWHRPSAGAESFVTRIRMVSFRRGEGFVGRAWATGAPGWLEDLRADAATVRAPEAVEAGLVSFLVVPVQVSGAAVVLHLMSHDPRPRDPELVQLASSLAIQIGAFVERQRQEEVAREAERRRRDELERSVAERTVELTAVNRELEAFSYSVSHDLRAPLRALDGFSQVLLEDYAEKIDQQGRDYLGRIRAASQRMSHLIDDLIQLSRVTRSELRRDEVDFSALVSEVAAEIQDREPGRSVEVAIDAGVRVRGDARLLRVALMNLVGNAFKFTRDAPHPRVEVGVTAGAEGRVYHVRDNGAGFDMAYAGKLFQPFQRLHARTEFEGTGIGLATVQRIVHRHGGRIWAEGTPGAGAAFHFTLGEF
jgi:PAS domain S-box-containing protein